MSSWVRYSVAVYVGLLISGALAHQPLLGHTPPQPATPCVDRDEVLPVHPLPPSVAPELDAGQDAAV